MRLDIPVYISKDNVYSIRVESSSDSENEDGLEAGKHDIIVLHEKAGNQSMFRSRKHHPMFPFHEEKVRRKDKGQ